MEDEEEMEGEEGRIKRGIGESKGGEEERGKEEAGCHTLTPLFFSCCPSPPPTTLVEEPAQLDAEHRHSDTLSG